MWSAETLPSAGGRTIRDSIQEIAEGSLAAVRIPNVYNDDERAVILDNILSEGINWYPNFENKQGRIGICATEYFSKEDGKKLYFASEPEASAKKDRIFPGDLEPIGRMANIFAGEFDTSVAREPSEKNAKYFTGLIRAMNQQSTTHFDFAPRQLPGWHVGKVTDTQFAVVIYLQPAESGGELTIYNRRWQQEDDEHDNDVEEKGPLGFDGTFLDGEESLTISPAVGETIIFSPRNFHRVEKIGSSAIRLSINSFMSLTADDKLLLWN